MTMPETIWVLPPIDMDGFTFPAETTTPNFPNANEYILLSSVQGLIDAAFGEAAAMAIARSGEGSDSMPHPYDKGYLAACKDIANAIRTKIGGAE